jgi:hypothetical protein
MSIYEILPALDLSQSVHAKISIGMHRGVKLKISRIPLNGLIGLETRLGWRTDRKFFGILISTRLHFHLPDRTSWVPLSLARRRISLAPCNRTTVNVEHCIVMYYWYDVINANKMTQWTCTFVCFSTVDDMNLLIWSSPINYKKSMEFHIFIIEIELQYQYLNYITGIPVL